MKGSSHLSGASPTVDEPAAGGSTYAEGAGHGSGARLARMARLFSRAWKLLWARDFDELLRGFFDNVPRELFHFDICYVLETTKAAPPIRRQTDIRVSLGSPEDIGRLKQLFPREGGSVFEERLAAGQIALVCRVGETRCGMSWLNLGPEHVEHEKFCTFLFSTGMSWIYDVAVSTEFQRKGCATSLLFKAFEFARARGRAGVCAYVSWNNRASLKVFEGNGYRRVQKMTVLNLLGLRVHRVRDLDGVAAPYTRIGFRSDARIRVAPGRD